MGIPCWVRMFYIWASHVPGLGLPQTDSRDIYSWLFADFKMLP